MLTVFYSWLFCSDCWAHSGQKLQIFLHHLRLAESFASLSHSKHLSLCMSPVSLWSLWVALWVHHNVNHSSRKAQVQLTLWKTCLSLENPIHPLPHRSPNLRKHLYNNQRIFGVFSPSPLYIWLSASLPRNSILRSQIFGLPGLQ